MKKSRSMFKRLGSLTIAGILVFTASASLVLLGAPLCLAGADWGPEGIVVSNAYSYQESSAIVSDGAGGAIITYEDYRGGSSDIYAQRISPSGESLWATSGVPVCSANYGQDYPEIISDGAGGAIITWEDYRSNNYDEIYAQRISPSGAVQWTPSGVLICSAGDDAVRPIITDDNAGGAIITWRDYRDATYYHIYAQRVNPGGNVMWTANGVPVCVATGSQSSPQIITDGYGGAVVAWQDNRNLDNNYNIYAQRLNPSGGALWTVNGVPVCTADDAQFYPTLTGSGSGSSIVTWEDDRSGEYPDVYAQKVDGLGNVQWTANGIVVCNATGSQTDPNITTDDAGGAIIAWHDLRLSPMNIYAQKLAADGAWGWTANGVPVTTDYASDMSLGILSDGMGGAFLCWNTFSWYFYAGQQHLAGQYTKQKSSPFGDSEIRVQKLLANGQYCPGWTEDGLPTTTSTDFPRAEEVMTTDNAGGVIVAWSQVDENLEQEDVFAQRMRTTDSTWYLAEGSQSWGYDMYLTVENPNPTAVTARVTYMTPQGPTEPRNYTLPANSQTTMSPRWVLDYPTDLSTKVECLEGLPIAVDRTMFWTGIGAPCQEAHSSVGVNSPATRWYMPEGSSKWGFETWLLIQNPNSVEATCSITYMIEGESPVKVEKKIPANTRRSFNMAEDIGAKDASIMLSSNLPVVPERSMYRNNRREGHESVGTTETSTDYYLAEGTTAWGFTTYVLVQNPNSNPCIVTLNFMTPGGSKTMDPFSMAPFSRKTIRVNDLLPNTDVSTQVHADQPIIAERSMYWGEGTPLGEATHDSIGTPASHKSFYLPDGQSSEGRETWTLVQNPNEDPVEVRITYLTPDGTGNQTFTETLNPFSRKTFNLKDKVDSGRAAVLVECLTSGKKVIAERAMYWNNRGTGTCTIGGSSD